VTFKFGAWVWHSGDHDLHKHVCQDKVQLERKAKKGMTEAIDAMIKTRMLHTYLCFFAFFQLAQGAFQVLISINNVLLHLLAVRK
jgi:hypothetical protein